MDDIFADYTLNKLERSLHWLENAHERYMREDVDSQEHGGYIEEATIYGNLINCKMAITTEILEMIYQHNKQRLESSILDLKKKIGR